MTDARGSAARFPRTTVITAVRSLWALQPSPGPRVWIALRATISMAVPLAIATFFGREDLGLQTATGAFVSLFFAGATAAERAKTLPWVAATLIGCAALGAALAPWPLVLAGGLVFVAILVSTLAFAFRLGPPGPVFFVLSYGLAANITAVVDGERLNDPWVLFGAMACGAGFSYLVALSPLLRRAERRRPVRSLHELLPGPYLGPGERELVLRVMLVAVCGTAVSLLVLDPHRAYWTVASGIAVVGMSAVRSYSFSRGLHRTLGTLAGAGVYLVIAPLGQFPWLLVLLIALLQFGIETSVVRNYALALLFITPLVLLITGAATGGMGSEAAVWERVIDTAVGSLIAMLSSLLHRRPPAVASPPG